MSDETRRPAAGRPADAEDPRRAVTPDRDRRRDPRDDPGILDLGSVRETDGDQDGGWAESVTHAGGAGAGPEDAGDWTELVAPDISADGWTEPGRGPESAGLGEAWSRYDRVMSGEEEE